MELLDISVSVGNGSIDAGNAISVLLRDPIGILQQSLIPDLTTVTPPTLVQQLPRFNSFMRPKEVQE